MAERLTRRWRREAAADRRRDDPCPSRSASLHIDESVDETETRERLRTRLDASIVWDTVPRRVKRPLLESAQLKLLGRVPRRFAHRPDRSPLPAPPSRGVARRFRIFLRHDLHEFRDALRARARELRRGNDARDAEFQKSTGVIELIERRRDDDLSRARRRSPPRASRRLRYGRRPRTSEGARGGPRSRSARFGGAAIREVSEGGRRSGWRVRRIAAAGGRCRSSSATAATAAAAGRARGVTRPRDKHPGRRRAREKRLDVDGKRSRTEVSVAREARKPDDGNPRGQSARRRAEPLGPQRGGGGTETSGYTRATRG